MYSYNMTNSVTSNEYMCRIKELENELVTLRKEFSENTIIQSMNDMRDQYKELEESYNYMEKTITNLETSLVQTVSKSLYNDILERFSIEKRNKQAIKQTLNRLSSKIQEEQGMTASLRQEYKTIVNFISSL
jgi:predicted  nucleic acid-binding Zn-ribbon protein